MRIDYLFNHIQVSAQPCGDSYCAAWPSPSPQPGLRRSASAALAAQAAALAAGQSTPDWACSPPNLVWTPQPLRAAQEASVTKEAAQEASAAREAALEASAAREAALEAS